MEWHPVLLLLARAIGARPLHPSLPARHNASPGLVPNYRKRKKFAWKRLDSGAVDQPRMWHAQITQSGLYYPSQTQAVEHRHRGSPSKSQEGSRSLPVTALVLKSAFPWDRHFSLAKLRRGLDREKIT